jgi:peptide/nickel transport system permease protein
MNDTVAGSPAAGVALPQLVQAGRPRARRLGRALGRTPVAVIGATTVALVVVVALAAPWLAPYDPVAQIAKPLLPPGGAHLAGTDEFGRDELSRLIHGARISLYVGGLAVLIALAFGATSGVLAGYYGGWVDDVTMRVMDILLSLPALVLAIAITSVLGPTLTNAMIAIGIVYAPTFARVARGRRWRSSACPTSRPRARSGAPTARSSSATSCRTSRPPSWSRPRCRSPLRSSPRRRSPSSGWGPSHRPPRGGSC